MITQERLTVHKRWLENPSGKGRLVAVAEDLSSANLSSADLRSADLRGADLRSADLCSADLRDASLRGANLRGANLSGANLGAANLRGANLSGASLRGADLRGASLRGADLSDANLSGADIRGANLRDASLRDASLRGANLRGAYLRGADIRGTYLRGTDLSGVKGYRCPSEWVAAQEVDPGGRGLVVYKQFGLHYQAPVDWRIEPGAVITEVVNPDRGTECGSGINVAPQSWDGFDNAKTLWRLLIEWRDLCTLVVPFGTDGKARVGRATLLEEVSK